jgi:hypothetical protein
MSVEQALSTTSFTGKLKIDAKEYEFEAEDLVDLGEIGRGAFGSVNKMLFQKNSKGMNPFFSAGNGLDQP